MRLAPGFGLDVARRLAGGLATKHRDGKLIRYRLTEDARRLLGAAFDRPLPVSVIIGSTRQAEGAR